MLNYFANAINSSKLFSGMVMIILNIGSKYITVKLSKSQEAYLGGGIARQLLIFSVIWMGTRDVLVSIGMTAAFFVLTQHMFNEESPFCIIPEQLRKYEDLLDENHDGHITPGEIENARRLLDKAKKNDRKRNHLRHLETFRSRLIY